MFDAVGKTADLAVQLVYTGDAIEEGLEGLFQKAGELGVRGILCFFLSVPYSRKTVIINKKSGDCVEN